MIFKDVERELTQLFSTKFPEVNVKLSKVDSDIDDAIMFKSSFDDGNKFIGFKIRDNSIIEINASHRHLENAHKLFSLNKVKVDSFNIIPVFLNLLSKNSNFNRVFTLFNSINEKKIFRFYTSGRAYILPCITADHGFSRLTSVLDETYSQLYLENSFKLSRNGKFLPVPIIRVFVDQNNEQVFAFNLYDQQVYKVKKKLFYFEDFFEAAELFDVDYHGDILVDEYIDHQVINGLIDEKSIRESLIVLPRDQLKNKIDLISMYLI
jgi:hypothetical protein